MNKKKFKEIVDTSKDINQDIRILTYKKGVLGEEIYLEYHDKKGDKTVGFTPNLKN